MKNAVCCAAMLVAASLFAERQGIWPEGRIPDFQPQQIAAMTDEAGNPAFDAAAHRMPYLEWYAKPTKPNGACMILISGGSYKNCCDVKLIQRWRDQLTEAGYQTVNFVYRTPRPEGLPIYQSAWEDGQRAVRLVRSQAQTRGFDPERIGVICMSAGGHLGVLLGTNSQTPAYSRVDALDDVPCHVNWVIANAPAYNTQAGATGNATPKVGLTEEATINPCFAFDAKTCPMSLHHGGVDPYTPNGSTLVYRELRKRGIPAELHLYADKTHGAHGFERALEFMRQMNFDKRLGKTRALDHRFFPGDTICTEKEMLWPEGKMPDKSEKQKYAPYLVWFVPEKLTTKAIQVVVPGGGYNFCNINGEGTPVAHYLNGKGMTTVLVEYRCPRPVGKPKHFSGWQDAQRAIRMVRAEAPSRGLDPNRIGLMGFSAGGHLTLMTATNARTPAYEPVDAIDRQPCNVQWACPIYPAYVLTDGVDVPNTTKGTGDDVQIVPEFAFDADTPPMCFMHGDRDVWAAMNSVKCWEKLRAMGIQCDLHTLATRGHCFQIDAAPDTGSWTWLDQIWDFLVRKGLAH